MNLCSGLETKTDGKKKFLSVVAIFKDEARYVKEWIEYHRLVGVDHFYLYNNGSTDSYLEVLSPYVQEGSVTIIDWKDGDVPADCKDKKYNWVKCTQIPAYVDACKKTTQETTWLAMIDIDEFMVPVSSPTMVDLLQKYRDAPGVMLHWLLYGTSHVASLPPNKLLIEVLHMIGCPSLDFNTNIVKSIVKPELFKDFKMAPHTCTFQDGKEAVLLDRKEAQLNHYMNRTVDYFLNDKLPKKEHMDNVHFSKSEVERMMNFGNDMEDTERAIFKFVPSLRQKMGYDRT